jgi:hypothetical protein
MTTLQQLHDRLVAARQGATLTLSAGSAGAVAIDAFLATLPARSLTLQSARIELQGRQAQSLVVAGQINANWELPGVSAPALGMQAVTVTYQQAGPTDPVTATMAVSATLPVGSQPLRLDGTLGANSVLSFQVSQGGHGNMALSDAVTLATEGRAADWLPASVPAFSRLQLSSCTLSLGYAPGVTTTMEFSLNAEPNQQWPILPGHVLTDLGVTFATEYLISAGLSARHSFGGNVHATLDLGRPVSVMVGLTPDNIWELELTDPAGLPAIATIAAIAGAEAEVRSGLQALGLGGITVRLVRIGVDRTAGKLAFLTAEGSMTVAGKAFDVYLQLPGLTIGGSLSPAAAPVSLTDLLTSLLGNAGGLPAIDISALSLSTTPAAGWYSLHVEVDDGGLAVGGYGLTEATMEIDKSSGGTAAGISALITLAGTPLVATGSYGPDWTLSAQADQIDLAALISEALAGLGLPSPLTGLQLGGVSASWNLSTGAFAFSGELDAAVQLGPQSVASTLTLTVDSAVSAGSRTTTAVLTGSLTLGGMDFGLHYAFTPGQQILTGTWNAHGHAGFADLASAFGLTVPAGDVTLPDLSLTSMSFTVDWSKAGEQEFQLTATTSIGDAFFVVARPQPGQPWAFAFGAAITGATRLSQVLGPVGVTAAELDFITLGGAVFLVASAAFPSLQLPVIGGQSVPVSAGVTAAVLVDLGATPARPDVTTLKTVLAGQPPVLFGEVTLSTSITAIAVTILLDGTLILPGPGTASVTLTDLSLIFKPDPVAMTVKGSVGFPLGSVPIVATGLLTIAANEVDGALNVQGQNGQVLPVPMGFQGVHLTDLGIEIGLTYEPPSLMMGVLGRFVIGPGPAAPQGPVPPRSLTAVPPDDEFVLIVGLEGEVPNPLLLSMYLQQLSLNAAVEAFTNQPSGLPDDISASDVMIYWCDAPAGLQQPDGTWAYPGLGFNAILDVFGVHAYGELKISSTSGISGDACIDPLAIPGVVSLTGTGPGTPAAYAGQVTIQPGGAQIEISTAASPYLTISWVVTLFSTVTQSMNAQITSSGFTFAVEGSAYGFSSALTCAFQTSGHLSMAFSVALTLDADLGTLNGVHLGAVHLADVGAACSLAASASPLAITIGASFEFDGSSLTMPALTVSTPFSSLPEIPAAIARQIENEATAIFADFTGTVAAYLGIAYRGLVAGADEIGSVLKTGYGQTQAQATAAMKAAGYTASDIGNALASGWDATATDVATTLRSAGYSVSDAGDVIKNAFNLGPDDLHAALQAAGYAASDIGSFFDDIGGDFAGWASSNLDPSNW